MNRDKNALSLKKYGLVILPAAAERILLPNIIHMKGHAGQDLLAVVDLQVLQEVPFVIFGLRYVDVYKRQKQHRSFQFLLIAFCYLLLYSNFTG